MTSHHPRPSWTSFRRLVPSHAQTRKVGSRPGQSRGQSRVGTLLPYPDPTRVDEWFLSQGLFRVRDVHGRCVDRRGRCHLPAEACRPRQIPDSVEVDDGRGWSSSELEQVCYKGQRSLFVVRSLVLFSTFEILVCVTVLDLNL